jgi:ABC-2 type transport system ATP-binding protein
VAGPRLLGRRRPATANQAATLVGAIEVLLLMDAIRCTQLVKTYPGRPPVEAVRGLDLAVRRGECFGLLGPNGAGKTTTIEILQGLLPATSGKVEVLGFRWGRHDEEIRQRIGTSLQETRLSDKLTALETVRLFRSFYRRGLDPRDALQRVSLEEKARSLVGKLSGGQRQRLALACALVADPELMFLDEPTTGLDPQSRRQLWEVILEYRAAGCTILLTTHYLDEAQRLCDRVGIVDHGKLIALGSPRELIASLGGDHVIEFTLEAAQADGRSPGSAALGWPAGFDPAALVDLPAVSGVRCDAGQIGLSVTQPHVALPALLDRLDHHGVQLASLSTRHASLEDVFIAVAGRHFREAEEEAVAQEA